MIKRSDEQCGSRQHLFDDLGNKPINKEAIYRRQLERAVTVLEKTKHTFKSKQLKGLREEIERVIDMP